MCKFNSFGSNFLVNIDKYVNRKYLNNDKSFTRTRKLSLRDAILYPLLQEGHTNSREANNYMKLITGDDFAMISQQAIGEKRGFINPEVYEDMYRDYVDDLYNQFYPDLTLKDYMILAGEIAMASQKANLHAQDYPRILMQSQDSYLMLKSLKKRAVKCI